MRIPILSILPLVLLLAACDSLLPRKLPKESPPLLDMDEPLLFFEEPADEEERQTLDPGSFTGVEVASARTSLDETDAPLGVLVRGVVENSPGDAAGLSPDDLILAVVMPDGSERDLSWPSEWRQLELDSAPGIRLGVIYDRAGLEQETELVPIRRIRPAGRQAVDRLRETERVGVVVRSATEVEARKCGLAPGAGAVVVGLSARSPWREAGIVFGDLIRAVGGVPVDHPQVVLDAIRDGTGPLDLEIVRGEDEIAVEAPLTRREQEVKHIGIPVLFDYEKDRDQKEVSVLLGVVQHETTAAAWEWRILWLIHFSGGDADRLEEVGK